MNWKNWFRPAPPKQIRRSFRPCLESLEIRETPSISHTFSSGVLTIRETASNVAHENVLLTPASGNSVDVKVGLTTPPTTDVGLFKGVSSVTVALGNGAGDTISVSDGAFSFAPTLTITEGNGAADVVSLLGTGATGTSILTGRVSVTQGAGAGDTISIGTTSTAGLTLTNTVTLSANSGVGTAVTIGGGTVATAAILTGGLTVSNTTGITIAANSEELGNLTVSNSSLGVNASSTIAGEIGGNVTYTGGSGTDSLTISGIIGGSLSYNGGANANTLTVSGVIGKNLSYTGPGADTFVFTGATVGGNVTLNFGNAANTYTLSGAYVIGGTLSVTAGNSVAGNTFSTGSGAGTIDGNLIVNFGNGTTANSFTITAGTVINGSLVSYRGGTGGDTVTVSSVSNGFALDIFLNGSVFGGGTDTVNLGVVTALGSLLIIENTGATTSWTPPVGGISWNTTFINWP